MNYDVFVNNKHYVTRASLSKAEDDLADLMSTYEVPESQKVGSIVGIMNHDGDILHVFERTKSGWRVNKFAMAIQ